MTAKSNAGHRPRGLGREIAAVLVIKTLALALIWRAWFWVVLIFLPLVVAYASWVYRVLRGKITVEAVREKSHTLY